MLPSTAGLSPELAALVTASRSGLSREAAHARLAAVLAKFPADHIKEREELLVQAVAQGAYDPPEWTTVTTTFKGRRAEIQVSTDALTILGVRIDVTADGAQRIADLLGTVLPTPRIVQLIWEQATVRIDPCTLPADEKMATTARMIEHSECVDDQLGGRKGLVANEGKHWVLTNRVAGNSKLAANYGWFVKGRPPIQTVGTHHDTGHTDYSQTMRLVKPTLRVDGREVSMQRVGRSPELWGLVSDEGPLLVWRASRPDAAPSSRKIPPAAAPTPAPAEPGSVRVTLRTDGMSLGQEKLPPSTTALRRSTLSRRVVSALRLRTEDVPEMAYVSAGAALCGGRDVFFELMNEMPVEFAELEQSKDTLVRALACGKALVPQARSGAKLYDIEYDYEGLPSSFALLPLSDDSLREKLVYPPLSPTPSGAHRAYCSDDQPGAPRSSCADGARSRWMLAVNRGYVAAYAREVPSLLERLAGSAPPPPAVVELAALFLEPTPAEEVAVAKRGATGGCGFALDFAFLDLLPDETHRQTLLDSIDENAVFCGSQASGSILDATRRLLFSAKDEKGAEAIESALKRRALEVRFEAGAIAANGSPRQQFSDAMRGAAARAAQAATVERNGRRLSFAMTLEPNAAEKRAMAP
ncbi:MAG TPA: hypothetical protein VNN72_27085, partial [Polyangiaceae bacterium]|nr:hypothetical protein [Polyangiaceae bacterium]